jgi:adhesin transport system outer membrane protein
MKYATWAKLRKQRLSQNSASKAILSDIKTVSCAQGAAELSFTQTYGSVDHSDIVEKTLSMELVKGQWKITRETVTKGRTY